MSRKTVAIIGLIVVFVIALLVNFLAGKMSLRADLTEYKTFTLSDGTVNILSNLDTPVEIRYYVTDDSKIMSPSERARAQRVEDLLAEFVREAPSKEIELPNEEGEFETQNVKMLSVKKLNPEPNTDAEDSAIIDGLQAGMSGETNNELYFGISIRCLDANEAIPFLPAREETMLEYDLIRAISSVHSGKDKKIVVMTSLPLAGGFGGNFQAPPQNPWYFYEQLSRDYEVETIPATATEIPEDANSLIVVHPYDITDEAMFAIDQYLLKGGNIMVFVDPNFFYSRAMAQGQPQMPGMPPQGGPPPSSNMEKLFKSWGVKYDANQVLADLAFGSAVAPRGDFSPTFLTLNQSALGSTEDAPGLTDPTTRMLNHLNMLTPGAFELSPAAGIRVEELVQTSPTNQLVSPFDADPSQEGGGERIRRDFEPFGQRRALVARLSGSFKTAFPEGDPAAVEEEESEEPAEGEKKKGEAKEEEKEKPEDKSLKNASAPGQILLVADVDFIFDDFVVQRSNIPGLGMIVRPRNENTTLVQNAAEQLSGNPDLINVRSRVTVRRPFTRQNEWRQAAEEKYAEEVAEFTEKASQAEARLNELISATPENIDQALLSKDVQDELKKLQQEEIEFSKRARELQKEVTREFRRKLATFKFGNVLLVPVLIVIFGIALALVRRRRTAAR